MSTLGLIGCGEWGANHVRVFTGMPGCEVVTCCDLERARLEMLRRTCRGIGTTTRYQDVLADDRIQAVVVATPTSTHPQMVREALLAGKDVLCEKPMALSTDEAEELVALAAARHRILMVGHVFLFHEGIRRLRAYVQDGTLGRIHYCYSIRANLGPIREDVNVVWDLAPHDLSIVAYVLGAHPLTVSAMGAAFLDASREDIAFITLTYPGGIMVNVHVSWLNPRKVREITVVGDQRMCVWNDLSTGAPLALYDRSVVPARPYRNFGEFQLRIREGDITMPKITVDEPLRQQAAHFLHCVETRQAPLVTGQDVLGVIRTLEAIDLSMHRQGGVVPMPQACAA